jgi:hypothetical protein
MPGSWRWTAYTTKDDQVYGYGDPTVLLAVTGYAATMSANSDIFVILLDIQSIRGVQKVCSLYLQKRQL